MTNSDTLNRRRFATGIFGVSISAASVFSILTASGDTGETEAVTSTVETYYEADDTPTLSSINQINRQHLPGDTIVVVVEISAGTEERVFVEDRNGWDVIKVDGGY